LHILTLITIQVEINSTLNIAWDCFTQPLHITNWNFASPDWCCPTAQSDLKIGGGFSYRMEAKDGSVGFDFEGNFIEIIFQQKIVTEFGDRQATVTFQQADKGILVIQSFVPENENPLELQQQGWQAILDNYKLYTEQLTQSVL
jgi:uncharacterized protein YndB with AHSA1/START domain